jgi:tetratricopeptide (TPR) repeat protein
MRLLLLVPVLMVLLSCGSEDELNQGFMDHVATVNRDSDTTLITLFDSLIDRGNLNNHELYYAFYAKAYIYGQNAKPALELWNYLEADRFLDNAKIAESEKYDCKSRLYNNIGTSYAAFSNANLEKEYYSKAVTYIQNYSAPYRNLAEWYVENGSFAKYDSMVSRALSEPDKLSFKDRAKLVTRYVFDLSKNGYSDKAISLGEGFREELKQIIDTVSNKKQLKSYAKYMEGLLVNLGSAYQFNGDTTRSIDYYKLSLDYVKLMERPAEAFTNLKNLGDVYLNQGAYDSSVHYYQKAIALYPEKERLPRNFEVFLELSECYRAQNDISNQLKYLDIFNSENEMFEAARILNAKKTQAEWSKFLAMQYDEKINDISYVNQLLFYVRVLVGVVVLLIVFVFVRYFSYTRAKV